MPWQKENCIWLCMEIQGGDVMLKISKKFNDFLHCSAKREYLEG